MKEFLVSNTNKLSIRKIIFDFVTKKRKGAKIFVENHAPFNGIADIEKIINNFQSEDLFEECFNFDVDLDTEDSVMLIEFEHNESNDVANLPTRSLTLDFKGKVIVGLKNNQLLYIGPANEPGYRIIWRVFKK